MIERISFLLKNHLEGNLSEQEYDELLDWASQSEEYQALLDEISDPERVSLILSDFLRSKALWNQSATMDFDNILSRTQPRSLVSRNWIQRIAIGIAAVCICSFSLAWYFFKPDRLVVSSQESIVRNESDIRSGTNQAILKISDQESIHLRDQKGVFINHEGVVDHQGHLIRSWAGLDMHHQLGLEVPQGGEYLVHLPDGSRVRLNSGSKLWFPRSFDKNTRDVILAGEGYFEIESRPDQPFYVRTDLQMIRVLGTTFNVKAYPEDHLVTTSLVSGAVEVKPIGQDIPLIRLSPGEVAVTNPVTAMKKSQAKVETEVSWQRGEFVFQETPFLEVIQSIARWYNVEVVYKDGHIPDESFTGQLGRDADFEVILEFFKNSGIICKIENGQLVIY